MVRLDKDSMDKWMMLLPGDLKGVVQEQTDCSEESLKVVSDGLGELSSLTGDGQVERVLDFVYRKQEDFANLDRARRIRFIAWMSGRPHSLSPKHLAILFDPKRRYAAAGEDEEDGDAGDSTMEKIAPVFLQDVVELMQALGPRAARTIFDGETLAIVATAGFEMAQKSTPGAGGV
ncbi:hypothetical protein [Roseibium sp. RKSG952]|uniref:hypothetical protein n=1 Tax=Roseibium sp. RKSG952 TaxID=2529384 RepID=UPI0012BC7C59|nr:hypothetical protein [Roseibium sp. RKSG952]MTH96702.1 hypothetical protein [Roseibium sp. RKSG952]